MKWLFQYHQRLGLMTNDLSTESWIEIVKQWNSHRATHVLVGDEQDSIKTESAALQQFCNELQRLLVHFNPSIKQDMTAEKQNIDLSCMARGKPDKSVEIST